MSEWLFDLGNTRLKCAPLRADGTVGEVVALAHADLAGLAAVLPADGTVAHVASVASADLKLDLLEVLARRFRRIAIARTQPMCAGLRIAYAQPDRLGVDRFLALLGTHVAGRSPALVVGVGTALTIDLLDRDGVHRGGRIAPSPALMRAALHARAPHLPESGGCYAEFADDTDAALASGCEGAAVALVERSQVAAAALLGAPPRVLLHGGGADALLAHLPAATVAPRLVLDGLARWARGDATAHAAPGAD